MPINHWEVRIIDVHGDSYVYGSYRGEEYARNIINSIQEHLKKTMLEQAGLGVFRVQSGHALIEKDITSVIAIPIPER
jgi:hypothetical protein